MKDWITISAFEQLTELNNRTIMLAIQRGLIPEDCISRTNKDDKGEAFLFDEVKAIEPVEPRKTTVPYYINPQPAAMHWFDNANITREPSAKIREKLAKYILTFNPSFFDDRPSDFPVDSSESEADDISNAEAIRRQNIKKNILLGIEIQKQKGILVEKAIVYDQLFSFGNELRNTLLFIPDRITDKVIAAIGNRTKTHGIIYDAIAEELEKLSDINNRLDYMGDP
jgi:hypothetical protein